MYSYELVNNHYIVEIDGQKFLIDTGTPSSFWVSHPIKEITIDGNKYPLKNRPLNFGVNQTNNLVGIIVDGFIGMDILSQTSLTIYSGREEKNIDFGEIPESLIENMRNDKTRHLIEAPMTTGWPLTVQIDSNLMTGKFVIDTGAKYGYGVSGLFHGQTSFDHVNDYNPSLRHLDSDIYHLEIAIGGEKKIIDVCNNSIVASTLLIHMGALMIGSVSSLYNDVCSLDTKKGKLILI